MEIQLLVIINSSILTRKKMYLLFFFYMTKYKLVLSYLNLLENFNFLLLYTTKIKYIIFESLNITHRITRFLLIY